MGKSNNSNFVVDLLLSDDDEEEEEVVGENSKDIARKYNRAIGGENVPKVDKTSDTKLQTRNRSTDGETPCNKGNNGLTSQAEKDAAASITPIGTIKNGVASSSKPFPKWDWNKTTNRKPSKKKEPPLKMVKTTTSQGLQAGLVLEEDIFAAFPQEASYEEAMAGDISPKPFELFEDRDFGPVASSIQGMHRASIADLDTRGNRLHDTKVSKQQQQNASTEKWRPRCRCSGVLASLSFKETDSLRAYFRCGRTGRGRKCQFFEWAFQAELIPWYRFGAHNHHVLVRQPATRVHSATTSATPRSESTPASATSSVFSAQDLVQGKVGDCWFLSALAVVAERSDLVERLFRTRPGEVGFEDDQRGVVRVNLFLDGIWTPVVMDNFLPCILGGRGKEEEELQRAIEASLLDASKNPIRNPYAKLKKAKHNADLYSSCTQRFPPTPSIQNNPHGLSISNIRIMNATSDFLREQYSKGKDRSISGNSNSFQPRLLKEGHLAQTLDLAYSKARRNQLWVPFLEKAYAKIHGSYKAISGGHVAEAFLDLTGAPTLQIGWHASRLASEGSSTLYRDPKRLWSDLKRWRAQELPMGCGTNHSAGGLIGMHAYSILDVREVSNVGVDFFRDRLLTGTLGNVSGFNEYDGKVRLLRVRNPHGQGEWKGEFSDKCDMWEKLMVNSGNTLPRTMANDGTFWIGYDDFLLGFSNIDVVLAHKGNHAKSFVSNFPPKKSNHRCQRAFEVSLIDPQPGLETKERVEVYVMGIQKSRRGARQGRADRKKSYKVSDFGILVGEYALGEESGDNGYSTIRGEGCSPNQPFGAVHGQMFGFQRNGHYKLVLDRKYCKRLVVMPVSFGHPAATDEFLSFVVRFNADAPLMIRELETVPRMDRVLGDFLVSPKPSGHFEKTRQGKKTTLWANRDFKVLQVDCRGNSGGTVFVYLCTSGSTGTGFAKMTESVSLSLEASCRGMSCRVQGGLLDYETTAKGKKFQASWRKFSTVVTIGAKSGEAGSERSRLLMVLYQSGQDTEMGTITCKSMGRILGTRNINDCKSPTKPAASATLDRYWKKPSVGTNGTQIDRQRDDYKELGIFHPIAMDAEAFRRCGSNYELNSSTSGFGPTHGEVLVDDADLEIAVALSRQEHDATVPAGANVDNNANGKLSVEEAMLQTVLMRSRLEHRTSAGGTVLPADDFSRDEAQMEDAPRRGHEERQSPKNEVLDLVGKRTAAGGAPANGLDTAVTIDLTAAEATVATGGAAKGSTAAAGSPEVLDLTAPDARASPLPPRDPPANRSAKQDGAGDGGVGTNLLVLLDSSDEEGDTGDRPSGSEAPPNGRVGGPSRADGSGNSGAGPSDAERLAKKRKLAADAAMKRLQRWP